MAASGFGRGSERTEGAIGASLDGFFLRRFSRDLPSGCVAACAGGGVGAEGEPFRLAGSLADACNIGAPLSAYMGAAQ